MKLLVLGLASTVAMAAPLLAQTTAPAGAPATAGATAGAAATAPAVTAGAVVNDASGAQVGTVESVSGSTAVISTGAAKASIPVSAFGKGQGSALVIGMTKTDLEAAVNKASKPTNIAVGTEVQGPKGGAVGKVAAVTGDLVTVETPTTKVQLPRNAFAQGTGGALMIGMTAEQLDAAAKAAAGGKPGA